jgi:adenosylcobinamide kinase / adenosylcobinamide-phosphate guanylyltransferase
MTTLITGGSRSGKSAFAQQLAEGLGQSRLFIATCPCIDPEMDERICRHRHDREGRGWKTAEEPLLLAERLGSVSTGTVVLLDCLTLWVSNLMHAAAQRGDELNEDQVAALAAQLGAAASRHQGRMVIVTNEVGFGIVPDNPAARRFRDLAGRCNQVVAAAADEVFLVCCGLPLRVK